MDLDFLLDSEPEQLPPGHRSGFVAVIGRPNVGKSTLLNRLLGQKIAITSPKPQTTRDQLLGILTEDDMQILFLDTPGIHRPQHKLGEFMVQVASEAIEDADVILWVVDANVPPTDEDVAIGQLLQELARRKKLPGPVLIGLNKLDRRPDGESIPPERIADYQSLLFAEHSDSDVDAASAEHRDENRNKNSDEANEQPLIDLYTVAFSALTGQGVDGLLAQLRALLPEGPRYYPADQVTDLQTRFIVAELIREKALMLLQQEVPHSIAVVVDEYTERSDKLTYISAIIYVERSSQKGIVLGKGGSKIKEIGRAARPEIEKLIESKVYLELWVKVWEKWRKRQGMLRRLGYAT